MTISEDEAEKLLWGYCVRLKNSIASLVTAPVTEGQFIALMSFTYNVGLGNLQKSTLLRKLNKEDYSGASEEFFRWVNVKGKFSQGLWNRRKEEKAHFEA